MKKSALICALLLAFVSTSYANDNVSAKLDANNAKSVETFISDNTSSNSQQAFPSEKVQQSCAIKT